MNTALRDAVITSITKLSIQGLKNSDILRIADTAMECSVPVEEPGPVSILLWCPSCHTRHVDLDEFVTKPHHTHACQGCGMVWRPAIVATVGVQFLPGFKD